MVQAMLKPVKINVNAKNAPAGAFQNGVEQVTPDKATATDDGHGDATVV